MVLRTTRRRDLTGSARGPSGRPGVLTVAAGIVVGLLLTSGSAMAVCTDNDGDGYTTCKNDCNDDDPSIHPKAGDTDCDGVDDDCNGLPDDGYTMANTTCGFAACYNTGKLKCLGGVEVDTCEPKPGAPADVACDLIDEDCDGQTDEDYISETVTCGKGACEMEGSTSCVAGGIVETCTPGLPTGPDNECDGVDQNCNGFADDLYVAPTTSCGTGACTQYGKAHCVDGAIDDTCNPSTADITDGDCDNVDDDCDGQTDEDFVGLPITCGKGVCKADGSTACQGGVVVNVCTKGSPTGDDTDCDGLDNDCSGIADDKFAPTVTTCGDGGCATSGWLMCSAGSVVDSCTPLTPAPDDADCDNADDDCDGVTDEDFVGVQKSCGKGVCFAADGTTACIDGSIETLCTPLPPTGDDTDCDGLDDDCNGIADDHYSKVQTTCGVGYCLDTGLTSCVDAQVVDNCSPGTPYPADATCDGIDDDCDGVADDDFVGAPTSCGKGVCQADGAMVCVDGEAVDGCVAGAPTGSDFDCDGLDNDCNGIADDKYIAPKTWCGEGHCTSSGKLVCDDGLLIDTCVQTGFSLDDQSCDGVDDDCDGVTDEDWAPEEVTCGVGVCEASGIEVCDAGVETVICTAGAPAATDADCDGVDDNCNGVADEEYVVTATACGIGQCASAGQLKCSAGAEVDTCKAGGPAPVDPCDGLDNDCDGDTDEGFVAEAVSCGQGACAATGTTVCEDGLIGEVCSPSPPISDDDATCDGVDDNCNGFADEHYVATHTECGVGACADSAKVLCVAGAEVDTCQPGDPAADDAVCNAIDDDCDGEVDEEFVAETVSCGIGACASEGTTVCSAGTVSEVCEPLPAASETDATCDGMDDDCDGATDEEYQITTVTCGTGACEANGSRVCQDAAEVDECTPGAPLAADDSTCDGVDDDCDGETDEDYVVLDTECGVGVCTAIGQMVCDGGSEVDTCAVGAPAGDDASCDGMDDDCDGDVDEDWLAMSIVCGLGACEAPGQTMCVDGSEVDNCTPFEPLAPTDVTCDEVDDDCDGDVDDDFAVIATACGVGACASDGELSCDQGAVVDTCQAGSPAAEDTTCDAVDDDCDGIADEDFETSATTCGAGACAASGQLVCSGGQELDDCAPGVAAADDATCDGQDDDCDGSIDEDATTSATTCGLGACAAQGEAECVDGAVVDSCTPGSPAADDVTCDGQDDDCDGATDEDWASAAIACGLGACAAQGETVCEGGAEVEDCSPGSPSADDSLCNGADDDCDGEVDEDFAVTPTACGAGACAAEGELVCEAGEVVDTCALVTPAAEDATCDGTDDDCDGEIDEDVAAEATTCGAGACAADGVSACVDGQMVDSCEPGAPLAASDTTCDGTDDDCDGAADDDFAAQATTCGDGACAAEGQLTCEDGVVSDSCVAGTGAADDATCDGVDDDCDGTDDEDVAAEPTTCGLGACTATGEASCQAGEMVDSCLAGDPQSGDDGTCDGVDDDCDGEMDEDFAAQATTCGEGACAAEGQLACEGGQTYDTCQAGTPAAEDTCDGQDNDCDGEVDEDAPTEATSCGQGACAAAGESVCEGGQLTDSCLVGDPVAADDATCDGVDDDCDGEVDEDCDPWAFCQNGMTWTVTQGDTSFVIAPVDGDTDIETFYGYAMDDKASASTGYEASDRVTTMLYRDPEGTLGLVSVIDEPRDDSGGKLDFDMVGLNQGAVAVKDDPNSKKDVVDVENGRYRWRWNPCCTDGMALTHLAEDLCITILPSQVNGIEGFDFIDGATGERMSLPPESDAIRLCATPCCVPTAADDLSCDGVDDDCDGETDEDYAAELTSCGKGSCAAEGEMSCVEGVEVDGCEPLPTSADSDPTCDGLDDDCDGEADEDFAGEPTACGVGACAADGETICESGAVVDTCQPGAAAEGDATCDGVDDDCDGAADEDTVVEATTCGVGLCAAVGSKSCEGGQWMDSCAPGAPLSDIDVTCDGVDDDCDGEFDDDHQLEGTTCGVGACLAEGQAVCVGGTLIDNCEPGTPAADDASCDGGDDDCDGLVDEDVAPEPSTCGVGACASEGQVLCDGGVMSDTCQAGTPLSGSDATCDAVDDDCDGDEDEDFLPEPTTCGLGSCAAVGASSCEGGVEVDTCQPAKPAAEDATCDGADDDCDGELDEDHAPEPSSCGVGACAAEGVQVCWGGTLLDSCEPGAAPSTSDATCDGVDDDCDGALDEDFVGYGTLCGSGACKNVGEVACLGGEVVDVCQPLTGAADDATCDGTDDDCDGVVDEDCQIDTCGATVGYEVSQGDASWVISPVETDGDVTTFYGYGVDAPWSASTGYEASDRGTVILHRDPVGALSLVFVIDGPNDGSGGDATLEVDGLAGAEVAVADDAPSDADHYDLETGELTWSWAGCCTDGIALEGLGDDLCITVTPMTVEGLTGFDVIDGATGERLAIPDGDQPFTICAAACCQPTSDVDACNGADDDCDGEVDEDHAVVETTCGAGACASFGLSECLDGAVVDSCQAGEALAEDDASCDGVDDDCDGAVDEDCVPTTCGATQGYVAGQGGVAVTVKPIETDGDVVSFYGYGVGAGGAWTASTGYEASDRTTLMLHRDPSGVTSLVVVHDADDGTDGHAIFHIDGATGGELVVEDDPTEGLDAYDHASGDYEWTWDECCTDGIAVADLGDELCVTITPLLLEGITGFDVIDGASGERTALPSLDEPITLCAAPCCAEYDASCDGVDDDCDGTTDEDGVDFAWTAEHGGQSWTLEPISGDTDAASFYGYGAEHHYSSSTGLEKRDATVAYLYRAPSGALSFVMHHDAAGSGSGGHVLLDVDGLASATVGVEDDPTGGADLYDLEGGTISQAWQPCCNDGLVVDDIGEDACFTITPQSVAGVDHLYVLSGDGSSQRLSFGDSLTICATACCTEPPTSADVPGFDVTQGRTTVGATPFETDGDAASFYGYEAVNAASASTGQEASGVMSLMFHRDPAGELSMLLVHDVAEDGTGGSIALTIDGLQGAEMAQFDDASHEEDGYDLAAGEFWWTWYPCCTDGMAVTKLPVEDCFTIAPQKLEGVEAIEVVAADGTRTTLPNLGAPFDVCPQPATSPSGLPACGD